MAAKKKAVSAILGTNGDDVLFGTDNADMISAGGGVDVVIAGGGNDIVDGGAGNDALDGGAGDDRLIGGDGNDTLTDHEGSNVFVGGAGHDAITTFGAQSANIDAGSGDDSISATFTSNVVVSAGDGADVVDVFYAAAARVDGGAGDDRIRLLDAGAASAEGGAGNDVIRIGFGATQATISTGSGSDTIVIQRPGGPSVTVTDFTAGKNGDVLDISHALGRLNGWDQSTNPFALGYLRAFQSGKDTLIQIDASGRADGAQFETIAVLSGVKASKLTSANFAPGYSPDGAAPPATTITGTPGDDAIVGTIGADTIRARGGNDSVNGGGGNDRIYGEDGNDSLRGDGGDDYLDGGAGDDWLEDYLGNDTFVGGAGNDTINAFNFGPGSASATIDGGDGNDTIASSRSGTIRAGAGDDFVSAVGATSIDLGTGNDFLSLAPVYFGAAVVTAVSAGDGNDILHINAAANVDGGAGNDVINVSAPGSAVTIKTGAGADRVVLSGWPGSLTTTVITDFTPGTGGDVLDFSGIEVQLQNWDGSTNPFATHHLRAVQSGADTLLEVDFDGTGAAYGYATFAVLSNVNAASLSSANLAPGWNPDGSPPAARTITGTEGADTLVGDVNDDTIYGRGGSDALSGGRGADVLYGGAGNDQLDGGAGNDELHGGADDDYLVDSLGANRFFGDGGNDAIVSTYADTVYAEGGEGDDRFELTGGHYIEAHGGAGNDAFLVAGAASMLIDGGDDDDAITVSGEPFGGGTYRVLGGGGEDLIRLYAAADVDAGLGSDRIELLSGYVSTVATGGGIDTIAPSVTGGPATTVTDFTSGAGGDIVDLGSVVPFLINWDGGNPFAGGFLRLTQSGGDALLELDVDGAAASNPSNALLVLQNVTASTLTADNFAQGYDPAALPPPPPGDQVIVGDDDPNLLNDGPGNDRLFGLGGDDTLIGSGGNDLLDGGDGDDTLQDDVGDNTFVGFDGNDTIRTSLTTSAVIDAGNGDDEVFAFAVGHVEADGGDGKDYMEIAGTSAHVDLGGGDDTLYLNTFFGAVFGGTGDDVVRFGGTGSVDLGDGSDRVEIYSLQPVSVTTGAGPDVVDIRAAGPASITVTDFTAGFGGDALDVRALLAPTPGAIATDYFSVADDGSGNSAVYFDRDGTGTVYGPDQIATLSNVTGLDAFGMIANGNLIV